MEGLLEALAALGLKLFGEVDVGGEGDVYVEGLGLDDGDDAEVGVEGCGEGDGGGEGVLGGLGLVVGDGDFVEHGLLPKEVM